MATEYQLRTWWKPWLCQPTKMVKVEFPGDGRVWLLLIARPAAPAFRLLARAMVETGYLFRESDGGTYNCRRKASGGWSPHAEGCALDLNPSKNPYGAPLRHNYPAEFIQLVEGIRTGNGTQAITWGGRWRTPDSMHWQINASPTDLGSGVLYPGPAPAPTPTPPPTTGNDDLGDDMWQYLNIDETFVRRMWDLGYLQPKTDFTLQYFLDNLAELQKGSMSAVRANFQEDWLAFRRAVTNGTVRR